MNGVGSTFLLRSAGTPLLVLLLVVAAGCSSTRGIVAPFGEDDPIPAGEGEQAGLDLSELESISRHLTERGITRSIRFS